jgi:lipoprotein-releasing system permease protein
MKYAFFISSRYMFSKNKKSIVSKISTIAVITTALSIMMPLLMLSLMNGFHDSIQSALMENEFHIVVYRNRHAPITPVEGENLGTDEWYKRHIDKLIDTIWSVNEMEEYKGIMPVNIKTEQIPDLMEKRDEPMIKAVVPYVEGEGLIRTSLDWKPIAIKGMTEDINKSESFNNRLLINAGEFNFQKNHRIMIGKDLAEKLDINIERVEMGKGPLIDIVTDIGGRNNIDPRIMQHQVSALYTSGYMEIDSRVVFTTAKRAMYLLNQDRYTGIGIHLKDPAYIETMIPQLNRLIRLKVSSGYNVNSGTERWENQFRAFEWEKRLIFFVVAIMILAAFLTIFITLNILVINKHEEIGILRSMGVDANTIRLVFLIQGFLIGIAGSIIGVVVGLFVTTSINEIAMAGQWLVNEFLKGIYNTPIYNLLGIPVAPGEFNIIESSTVLTGSRVNYVIYITDIVIVLTGAIFTSLLAAFFPSSKAAKKNIVEVLRYE